MRTFALIALFVAAFVLALAARIPLSAALMLSGAREAGLDWDAAEGTVWSGAVRGVRLYDYEIGDVRAALAPASLLAAAPRVALMLEGPEARAEAHVTLRPGGAIRIEGGSAVLALSELVAIDPRLRARGGTLDARGVAVTLRDGRCASASGRLATDALTYGFGGAWRGPALAGAIACEDGVLVMTLAGADEGERVQARANLGAGAYRVVALLDSSDPEVARLAPVIGFAETGEGWRYEWSFAP
jgi:hypothetical protein